MIYVITGHLGSGKSLLAIRIAHDYLKAGKRVASNITINLHEMMPASNKLCAVKLPYIPQAQHLNALGRGDVVGDWQLGQGIVQYADTQAEDKHKKKKKYDESKFGLIILDEAGTWLNSRDWSDKDRRGLFQWITHARKLGWDVALIVQDYEALDAQIRRSVTEVHVKCVRLDRLKIPFLPIKMPRYHLATGRYLGPTGAITQRWFAKGDDYFEAYDTRESVKSEDLWTDTGPVDMRANHTLLSSWHVRGRYLPPWPHRTTYVLFAVKWLLVLIAALFLLPLGLRSGLRGNIKRLRENLETDIRYVFARFLWKPPTDSAAH